MNKKFYLRESTSDLKSAVNIFFKAKKLKPELELVYLIPQEELLQSSLENSLESTLKQLQAYGVDLSNLTVCVESEEKVLTESEWSHLQSVQENLSARGINVGVEDYGKTWTLKEVERANIGIEKVANKIKSYNFSPLEKLLNAYVSVTQRDYAKEEENEDPSISRSIYGVLNSNKIVCVGYSSLLKAIMASVDDKNIQIVENTIATTNDTHSVKTYHRNLIVHIKDKKYGIDGYYLLDPTWDSQNNKHKLNFFLVPLEDIDNLKAIILDRNTKTIKKAEKTQKKSKILEFFKRKNVDCVSFSRDGFKINSEFLKILKLNNTELFKKYRDEYLYFIEKRNNNILKKLDEIVEERVRAFKSDEYDNLDKYKDISEDFSLKLHNFLQKNPELIEKLNNINLRKIFPVVREYDVNFTYEDVFERFKAEIKSKSLISSKINRNTELEDMASFLAGQTERVKKDLLKQSKPISRECMQSALYQVLKENNPKRAKDEVYMKTLSIIEANTRAAKRIYTNKAKNFFAREYYEHNQ